VLREPLELGRVEDRAGRGDVLDVEELDELGAREHLLVAVRPPEPRQVIHQRIAGMPESRKAWTDVAP